MRTAHATGDRPDLRAFYTIYRRLLSSPAFIHRSNHLDHPPGKGKPAESELGRGVATPSRRSSPPTAANSGWRRETSKRRSHRRGCHSDPTGYLSGRYGTNELHRSTHNRCVLLFSSRTWPFAALRSRPHDGGPDQPSETVGDRIGPPASATRPPARIRDLPR